MNKQKWILILLLFIVGVTTRFPFAEKMQSHWDGPQWSMGIVRYALTQETPAPPGYPLYIGLGKLFYLFTQDTHRSLIWISIFYSGIGTVVFYLAGKKIFNQTVGIISSLLYLTGSTFYYFGLTAYPYGLIVVNSTIFALIIYSVIFERKIWGILLGVFFAYILGIRPQEFLFLFPLFLYGMNFLNLKQRIVAIVSFISLLLLWFIPLVASAGGVNDYVKIITVFGKNGALPPVQFIRGPNDYLMLIKGMYLSYGLSLFFGFYYLLKIRKKWKARYFKNLFRNKLFTFFFLWIAPALLFNIFVRSDHAGHQMTYHSGFLILIAYVIYKILDKSKYFYLGLSAILVFNLFTFFRDRDPEMKKLYVPTSFHYSEIRKNDLRLLSKITYIKKNFVPKETLLITSGDIFRPTMYYFPEFLVYEISGLTTDDEKFKYIQRKAKNWNFEQDLNKNMSFHIPHGFHYLVFMNDEAGYWGINRPTKKVNLKANGIITILKVNEYDNFLYKKNVVTQL